MTLWLLILALIAAWLVISIGIALIVGDMLKIVSQSYPAVCTCRRYAVSPRCPRHGWESA